MEFMYIFCCLYSKSTTHYLLIFFLFKTEYHFSIFLVAANYKDDKHDMCAASIENAASKLDVEPCFIYVFILVSYL